MNFRTTIAPGALSFLVGGVVHDTHAQAQPATAVIFENVGIERRDA